MLVLPEEQRAQYGDLEQAFSKLKCVAGGVERWESVRNGFGCLGASVEQVLIHDVARPFVPASVIRS